MTKKHFIALADALRKSKPIEAHFSNLGEYLAVKTQWENDCHCIAIACEQANPAVNRERWLGYVNGENGPSGGAVR